MKRAGEASFLDVGGKRANVAALKEFLIHGVKYAFPARWGPIVRGLPTAHSAPPLCDVIEGRAEPVVWADPGGEVRGESLEPLFKSAPMAARRDSKLYESLALIDALRSGRARERAVAAKKLEEMFAG